MSFMNMATSLRIISYKQTELWQTLIKLLTLIYFLGFPVGSDGKEFACQAVGTTWFFSSCGGILELRRGSQPSPWVGPGKQNLPLGWRGKAGGCARAKCRFGFQVSKVGRDFASPAGSQVITCCGPVEHMRLDNFHKWHFGS